MGYGPSIDIFYGYVWDDCATLLDDLWGDEEDHDTDSWVEWLLQSRGLVDPWSLYEERPSSLVGYEARQAYTQEWIADHRSEIDEWNAQKKAVQVEWGVEILTFGNVMDSYSIPCLRSTTLTAHSYSWEALDMSEFLAKVGDFDKGIAGGELQRFITTFKLDMSETQGPRWWAVPTYG